MYRLNSFDDKSEEEEWMILDIDRYIYIYIASLYWLSCPFLSCKTALGALNLYSFFCSGLAWNRSHLAPGMCQLHHGPCQTEQISKARLEDPSCPSYPCTLITANLGLPAGLDMKGWKFWRGHASWPKRSTVISCLKLFCFTLFVFPNQVLWSSRSSTTLPVPSQRPALLKSARSLNLIQSYKSESETSKFHK